MTELVTDKKQSAKFCKYCGKFKPYNEFSWLPSVNRYHNYCKACDKVYKQKWYMLNKERVDARHKKWQEENYTLHLEHQRRYNSKRIKNDMQ